MLARWNRPNTTTRPGKNGSMRCCVFCSVPSGALLPSTSCVGGIEELGPGAYDEMSYCERWIASVTNNLIEKGVLNVDELGRKMAEVEARWDADRAAKKEMQGEGAE